MSQEIFSSQRITNPIGQIRGSEFARIVMGTVVGFGQNFQVQYARQSRPIMSIGEPQVYFAPGVGQGNVSMGRLLGADGMFSLLNNGVGDCGRVTSLQLTLAGGRCVVAPTQSLAFGGGMLETVGLSLAAANPEIVETYGIRISSLERVDVG